MFEHFADLVIGGFQDFKEAWFFHIITHLFDEHVGLALWVDEQRTSLRILEDDCILNRQIVVRQPVQPLPAFYDYFLTCNPDETYVVGHRDVVLPDLLDPDFG